MIGVHAVVDVCIFTPAAILSNIINPDNQSDLDSAGNLSDSNKYRKFLFQIL